MRGLMMDKPLLISSLIQHAEDYHGATEIVSRTVEGPIHTYTYAEAAKRARQLVNALGSLGVKPGDRIGTLAWNGYRHFETYYAVSGMGAVCHTINPRLFPPQISYIISHAEDSYLFVDLTFIPLLEGISCRQPRQGQGRGRADRPPAYARVEAAQSPVLRGSGPQPFRPVRVAGV